MYNVVFIVVVRQCKCNIFKAKHKTCLFHMPMEKIFFIPNTIGGKKEEGLVDIFSSVNKLILNNLTINKQFTV